MIFKKLFYNLIKSSRYIKSSHRWSLMYKNINSDDYIDIKQPPHLARADCFIVEGENKLYVFFEEFVIEPNRKGYLSVGILDIKSNELINVQKILEKEYHLSYPFVFEYKSDWYMIPETHSNKTIDLYKFTEFPYKLEKVKTLIDNIDAVDTTLFFHNEYVYLFTNIKRDGKIHNENLSLFYSNDLLKGDFIEYSKNPLNTDLRYARMAGGILTEDNQMYRIAQDCSITYGSCMYKFKIEEISPSRYKEKLVEVINPPSSSIASHTYSKTDNYEIIDVIHRTNLAGMFVNIISLIKTILKKVRNV